MHRTNHIYYEQEQELHGYLAYDPKQEHPRPAVLIAHDWSGRTDFSCEKAELLAEMGYVGFALDMFGAAQTGIEIEEKQALISPLLADRAQLQYRMLAAFNTLRALPQVDAQKIAVIGYCFGGLCALDLARSGADIRGAVSFHGLLNKPDLPKTQAIKAKILVLHGYDDPMVQPEQVHEFCTEMSQEEVDWQVHMYGQVQHGFTNPKAHDAKLGIEYHVIAAERAWLSMTNFLREIF